MGWPVALLLPNHCTLFYGGAQLRNFKTSVGRSPFPPFSNCVGYHLLPRMLPSAGSI